MANYEKVYEKAGELTFDRFKFNEPDIDMLVINDENDFLEHLRVQGAGMAYYTALYEQCKREYDQYERMVKYRYNEMYSTCSDVLLNKGKKNNVRDIEAAVRTTYSNELDRMEKKLDELKKERDNVGAFLEGWKQKSYILSSMADMIKAGLLTPREAITNDEGGKPKPSEKFKEMLKEREKKKQETETF